MEAHEKQIMAARTALILDDPFFGRLSMKLRLKVDPSCKTAWVDGRTLGYNPTYIESLTHAQRVGLVAHEVMHVAAGHPWRRDARDPKRWNRAADHAINPILVGAGYKLPEGALLDEENEGKSAEWIYARQPQPQEPEQGEDENEPEQGDDSDDGEQGEGPSGPSDEEQDSDDGDEQGDESDDADENDGDDADGEESGDEDGDEEQDGNGEGDEEQDSDESDDGEGDDGDEEQPGEVRDAPEDASDDGSTEADWKIAVQQAANGAKAQGKLSGELERFAADAAKSQVDWRSALRRFVQETAAADYTWKRPSARYIARGMYMPALRSEQMGPMVIAIDTSGSVDEVMLALFESELRAIIDETNPQRVHVMYCDAAVKRTDTYETGDEIELNAEGGGGTKFGPVFDAIDQLDEQPACVVYLTDLEPWGENGWPAIEPEVPTLWAATKDHEVPFGEVLLVNE